MQFHVYFVFVPNSMQKSKRTHKPPPTHRFVATAVEIESQVTRVHVICKFRFKLIIMLIMMSSDRSRPSVFCFIFFRFILCLFLVDYVIFIYIYFVFSFCNIYLNQSVFFIS